MVASKSVYVQEIKRNSSSEGKRITTKRCRCRRRLLLARCKLPPSPEDSDRPGADAIPGHDTNDVIIG